MEAPAIAPFRCPKCGKVCITQHHLRQHMEAAGHQQPELVGSIFEEAAAQAAAHAAANAASAAAQGVQEEPWDTRFLSLLAESRCTSKMPRATADQLKAHVADLVSDFKARVVARLGPEVEGGAASVEALTNDIFCIAQNFRSRDSELDLLHASPAYVAPCERFLGKHPVTGETFTAWDAPLDKTMETMLATQPETWADLSSFLKRWAKRSSHRRTDEAFGDGEWCISDTLDGVQFGNFMARVQFRAGQVPLIFMFYYDGLELVNGLGQARTTWELGCFYWALIPLKQEYRLGRDHLRLATVCLKRAITACSMEVVINGRESDGAAPQNTSWGAWMKLIASPEGMPLQTPLGPAVARGGTALLAADTPAAAQLQGTKEAVGPATKGICRECLCSQVGGAHRAPCSFLAGLPGWKRHCAGRKAPFKLRSVSDMKEYISLVQEVLAGTTTQADLDRWLQDRGVNTFLGGMWQLPFYSKVHGCPIDIMHIVFEGCGRQGIGALSYVMINEWGLMESELINLMSGYIKAHKLPANHFPHVNSTRVGHLKQGQAGGIPSSDCSFPGNAIQVAHLLLHLPGVFGSCVPPAEKKGNVWQMALLLCKITRYLWQRSFTAIDLVELDKAIWLHDTVMLSTPALQHLWKPKNHYMSHIPLNILHWGPPRCYWCIPFEHENQLIKNGASHGNFVNPVRDAAESKARDVALAHMKNRAAPAEE